MFTKTMESIERLNRAGYVIYQNKRIAIVREYNDSGRKNYLRDIGECLYMLVYGIISIVGFPFCLIYTLYKLLPKIYIKKGDK